MDGATQADNVMGGVRRGRMETNNRETLSPFVEELQRILIRRRLSWRGLANIIGYHPSWLSKILHGALPSADLVRRCDEALEADGKLIALARVKRYYRPAQLPAPPAGFVGRSGELSRMRKVLTAIERPRHTRIVVVDGPPGIGKTATTLKCVDDIARNEPERYPDGQLYADLRGHSRDGGPARPEEVLEEFLAALGIHAQDVPRNMEYQAKLYRSLIATRKILIVLDNAASSEQVEPLLPGSTECSVVVTSRRKLSGLAMRVETERVILNPMTINESTAVLRMVIGDACAAAEETSISSLAKLCGGSPLALRIAAERIAAHPHHPVSDLVEELAVEGQRLNGLATHDSLTMRTAFEWSYRELNDAEAFMFRLLGVHYGPHISVEAAAALTMTTAVKARNLLQSLHAAHLLEGVSHSRYRLHDLLRLYAAERIEVSDGLDNRKAAVDRLTRWYLRTASVGGRMLVPFRVNLLELADPESCPLVFEDEQAVLRWFDIEASNFTSVIELAAEYHLYDTAWKLGVVLFDYLRLLRNPGSTWLLISGIAQKAARAISNRYAEAWVETLLGEGYRWLRQYWRSQKLFESALSVRREIGDRHGEASTLTQLGFLAIDKENWAKAREHAQQATKLFAEIGDSHGWASSRLILADVYRAWRRCDDAMETLMSSLLVFKEINNYDGQGLTLAKIAEVYTMGNEHERALEFLERSLCARRRAGSRGGEADGLARRGCTLNALGRFSEARRSWQEALFLYEEIGDPRVADINRYLACGH